MSEDLPDPDLLALLPLAGTALERRVVADLQAAGFPSIRPAHGFLVQRLLTGPQLITTMAVDLGVTQQAVSKTAGELVRLGIVEQTVDPTDSRRRPLTLSTRGRTAVSRARTVRENLTDELTAAVGAADVAVAHRVVVVLLDLLGMTDHIARRTVPGPLPD